MPSGLHAPGEPRRRPYTSTSLMTCHRRPRFPAGLFLLRVSSEKYHQHLAIFWVRSLDQKETYPPGPFAPKVTHCPSAPPTRRPGHGHLSGRRPLRAPCCESRGHTQIDRHHGVGLSSQLLVFPAQTGAWERRGIQSRSDIAQIARSCRYARYCENTDHQMRVSSQAGFLRRWQGSWTWRGE